MRAEEEHPQLIYTDLKCQVELIIETLLKVISVELFSVPHAEDYMIKHKSSH